MQKGFSQIILITLIAAVAFFIGYYFYFSRPPQINDAPIANKYVPGKPASPTPATPTSSPISISKSPATNKKIAFIFEGEIWTVDSNGQNQTQITKDGFNKFGISISPDGSKIAYSTYPKDEKKRTNLGYYVGFNSGVAIMDLNSKKVTPLIPYGSIQNHYPVWSADGQYLTVWVGNGKSAKMFEVSTGGEILTLTGDVTDNPVSPIIFVPGSDKVSFVENHKLDISNKDGSQRETLAQGVDALRGVHEGPNIPQPPNWSKTGRYVTFYKNGDLHILDMNTNADSIIEKGAKSEIFADNDPMAYSLGFSFDDTKLYLNDSAKEKAIEYNIQSKTFKEIAPSEQSLILSPDQKTMVESMYSHSSKLSIIDLVDFSKRDCLGVYKYAYYSWSAGAAYTFRYDTWSPDSKGILGYNDYGRKGVYIINPKDCSIFNLNLGKEVSEGNAIWFP